MGLTNSGAAKRLLAASLFLLLGLTVYAQIPRPGELGAEIQRLERQLSSGMPAGTSAERHGILLRLARLRQLSGDIAGAAAIWLEAARIDPTDDTARVAGAYCLAAIGEWEKATLQLQPVLISGRRGAAVLQGFYLDACLRAWIAGDLSPLVSLSTNPDFASLRPIIYYTLWRVITRNPGSTVAGSAELWKSRLLAEFPNSLEARTAAVETAGDSSGISIVQGPIWLLFPGNAGSTPALPSLPITPSNPVTVAPFGGGPVLQTGAFSTEANANTQAEALRKAGFTAAVIRKQAAAKDGASGAELWAVIVPAGPDSAKTQQDLKRAGFDSFPVRN
jgi:cell division septation protein DedD